MKNVGEFGVRVNGWGVSRALSQPALDLLEQPGCAGMLMRPNLVTELGAYMGERGLGLRGGVHFPPDAGRFQIPAIVEPWFLAFNASIANHPVMVLDDQGWQCHRGGR